MKKKLVNAVLLAAVSATVMAGCGTVNVNINNTEEVETNEEEDLEGEDMSDLDAANNVAGLIDAIYVQERTEDTDAQCKAAKEAWDALTDEQKELVEGEFADPDYFGRDTGDASLDDPLNADDIGENEILVISFGTSFNDSRTNDIGGIEKAIAKANPDWSVRRALTSQIIINHVQARDDEKIDNVTQALDRAVANGVKNLVIQPTHLMHGAEYDEMMETVSGYVSDFESVKVAEPLLGEVGTDATVINEDKERVANLVTEEAAGIAGYDDVKAAVEEGIAFVFLGHGTSHTASITYDQMQTQMSELGYDNVFIGTVEGEPEGTDCEAIIDKVSESGYKKIILRPLMVVAGDHANNDMAGEDEDSWKSMMEASGKFESIECQIEGLGRIEGIEELYAEHVAAAFETEPLTASAEEEAEVSGNGVSDNEVKDADAESEVSENEAADVKEDENETGKETELKDGTYEAKFDTDSSMFHVNEALNGMGTLTVKDGEMVIHVSLAGDGIKNLYAGLAEDAAKEGAELLSPTEDEVTYEDGTKEIVCGFDIPVPALDTEFDVAIIGKKGVWYDHKVSVASPEK
ncbi:MAG: sirohydrochlorin cobaltochelatase [Lachnospiraceae bacterium]|nr:sirohydrochlorin cobaltochelatase [Lachnospiraceae bacterium]